MNEVYTFHARDGSTHFVSVTLERGQKLVHGATVVAEYDRDPDGDDDVLPPVFTGSFWGDPKELMIVG